MKMYSNRKRPTREPFKVLVIVCEGKTEKIYFDNYNKREWRNITIKTPDPRCTDPINLVKYAKRQKKRLNPDIIWCVFDVDTNDQDAINKAFKKAGKEIRIIMSNPCFELWYLLHFNYIECRLNIPDTIRMLKIHIPGYTKVKDVNNSIECNRGNAIKHAKKLNVLHVKNKTEMGSVDSNPSTQVFQIVECILDMVK